MDSNPSRNGSTEPYSGVGGGLTRGERAARAKMRPPPADLANEECPDPFDSDAPRKLYALFFRRMWALGTQPMADGDVLRALQVARAGVSQSDEPDRVLRSLPRVSHLGDDVIGPD